MKKVLGVLLIIIGIAATAFIVFMAFNGKYGMNQFITDLSSFRGNFGFLSLSLVSIAMTVLGFRLMKG
jgi:hypothetical protein